MNKFLAVTLGMILLLGGILPFRVGAQEIDPFYLQRLIGGEQAFLDGNYQTAVKELEIALFGIQGEEQLNAKAYVYLGMSHYHLNNKGKAETYLRDAKKLIGLEGMRAALVPDESVRFYLNRVLGKFKLLEPGAMESVGQKQDISTNKETIVRDFERQIRSSPQNVSLYYDLYEFHMENDNREAAKKAIENLIEKNPDEAKGYYLLGRIQYQQRDLRRAEKNLVKVFELQEKTPVNEYVMLEAKIYHILTVLLRGERQRAYRMFALWSERLTEDKTRYLDLEGQDRGIFQGIVESEEVRAEIERLENEGNSPAENIENIVPIAQVDTLPVLKERVNPNYPAGAAEKKIEGIVIVNVLISETGDVADVVVTQGLAGGFNEETIKAVRQWKYEPAVKDGQRVKVWKQWAITFKLRIE